MTLTTQDIQKIAKGETFSWEKANALASELSKMQKRYWSTADGKGEEGWRVTLEYDPEYQIELMEGYIKSMFALKEPCPYSGTQH